MTANARSTLTDPFADLQAATRAHRAEHSCEAYTFEDGPALVRVAQERVPKRILELGTPLGYTACCLAYGSPLAHVDSIEGDGEHARLARRQITHYGLDARISVHHGQFDAVLATLAPSYDMAFFDGFAPALATIRQLRNLLAEGGLLVCSNLQLGHGREAQRLAAELADRSHWQGLEPIERGRTVVLVKMVPPDNPQS